MIIHEKGYWVGTECEKEHKYDKKLAGGLLKFFNKNNCKSLVDFGCGMGDYVKFFNDNKLYTEGYDGNPNTPELTNNTCKVLDLSKNIKFKKKYDWVLSLEVGEHLPKIYEKTFINNLHVNNKYGVVLSWALKKQGGVGHFNEQDNCYIKDIFEKLGYINDIESEKELRKDVSLRWFRNTVMVFRKL